jgi:hypothetical protein
VAKTAARNPEVPPDYLPEYVDQAAKLCRLGVTGAKITDFFEKEWRATADEDGHLYEASPVKRFLRELRFLASQEACVCFHGVMVPCLAVLSRSSPNARMGCAFGRKGLTAKARAER